MSRFVRTFIVAWMLLSLALSLPLHAQESTETPSPEVTATLVPSVTPTPVIVEPPPPNPIPDDPTEPPATTPETLLGQFYALLKDGTYMVWAAAGVLVIVGAIKSIFALFGVNIVNSAAALLALGVQVAIWLGYAVANYFGQGDTFKATYLQVIDVIRALLPLAGSIFVGHVFYKAAAERDVPVIGFKADHSAALKKQTAKLLRDLKVPPIPSAEVDKIRLDEPVVPRE